MGTMSAVTPVILVSNKGDYDHHNSSHNDIESMKRSTLTDHYTVCGIPITTVVPG